MTMKEKYIAEVERHLPGLFSQLLGKEYSTIAPIVYDTVRTSIETVDHRERTAAYNRRAERNGR